MVSDNYPPLSFYIVGLLAKLTGDAVLAGRLLALASLGTSAVLAARVVWQIGRSREWALVSALVLLFYAIFPFGSYFGVNNPQWLGQAINLAALVLVTRANPRWRHFVMAAALIVVANLVKHNLIALPLAVTVWLYRLDRQACAIWIGWGAGLTGLACLGLYLIFGPAVFVEVLGYHRSFDAQNALEALGMLALFSPFVAAGVMLACRGSLDPRVELLLIYGLLALVWGTVQHLGAGVACNSHFSALIAATIIGGVLLGGSARGLLARPLQSGQRLALLAVLVLPGMLVVPQGIQASLAEVVDAPKTERKWERVIADVRQSPGPVLCEELAVCYLAGKPMVLDFFSYGQKLRAVGDSDGLIRQLAKQGPALLVLDCWKGGPKRQLRLPAPYMALMKREYRMVNSVPGSINEMARRG